LVGIGGGGHRQKKGQHMAEYYVYENWTIDRSRIHKGECGYAPKGMMKGYVAIPIRLPTGELTGYIGITEGKVPKEFHLSNVVTFPKKSA